MAALMDTWIEIIQYLLSENRSSGLGFEHYRFVQIKLVEHSSVVCEGLSPVHNFIRYFFEVCFQVHAHLLKAIVLGYKLLQFANRLKLGNLEC